MAGFKGYIDGSKKVNEVQVHQTPKELELSIKVDKLIKLVAMARPLAGMAHGEGMSQEADLFIDRSIEVTGMSATELNELGEKEYREAGIE